MLPDKEIIELYQQRKESAIEETRIKYSRYIFTIAFNVLSTKEDAEECENDTYFTVWNLIPPQVPLNFKIFLGRITKNKALDMYRKAHAEKRGAGMEVLLSELTEACPSAEEEADAIMLAKQISAFLRTLPEEKRIMFVKRYWYGMKVKDIAREMNISESKVSTTLHRVRADLKIELESEGIAI
ncbi:MAG: sigma-70 family RNA polymerase sigma factor [Ruminococcaceae bacterium]|nr:sigma-70 family RNA polymerase sigma factor [Oscillospiraceae bacterium]